MINKTIILSGSMANARKYAITEANNDRPLFNCEFATPEVLVSSLLGDVRIVSNKESAQLILKLIKDNDYGLKDKVTTIGAANKLLEVINDFRLSNMGVYKHIYDAKYSDLLEDYKKSFDEGTLDYICGLENVKKSKIEHKDVILKKLDDLDLSPLEEDIFKSVYGRIENITPAKCNQGIKGFFPCYGINNEILKVLDYISENDLNINDCEIVYTSDAYENLFRGILDSRGIDYSINNAHAKSTNLVTFMLDVLDYISNNYKYELLEEVLKNKCLDSKYLNEFYKTLYFPKYVVGYGRKRTEEFIIKDDFTNKENIKEFITDLLSFGEKDDFDYKLFLKFIYKYVKRSKEKKYLSNKLDDLEKLIIKSENKIKATIDELSSMRYSESDDNKLIISLLNKSFSLKKNLFIIGLSQNYVSGDDVENPFVLDADKYYEYLGKTKNIHVLINTKKKNEEALDYYINYSNSNIYLLYSYFNKIDFRPSSPSVYYLKKEGVVYNEKSDNGCNKYDVSKTPIHFTNKSVVSVNDEEDDEFDNGQLKELDDQKKHMDDEETVVVDVPKEETHDFHLSPSAIQNLLECPFRYYYEKISHLPNPSYPSLDDSVWLDKNTKGTFFHEILELYAKKALMEENYKNTLDMMIFDSVFNEALENAIALNAISNKSIALKEQEEIKSQAIKALNEIISDYNSTGYRTLDCEYALSNTKYSYKNISFSGSIDRVDGKIIEENGKKVLCIRIVDYKSGGYKSKNESKYVQHAIYSVCLGKSAVKGLFKKDYDEIVVNEFIYDYAFDGKKNVYSKDEIEDEIKKVFSELDRLLANYIDPNVNSCYDEFDSYFNEKYSSKESNDKHESRLCSYCKYKSVCIKRLKEGKEWQI